MGHLSYGQWREISIADPKALEKRIGVSLRDQALLQQALVHRSFLNENPDSPLASNERLEFLGDAVLGLVTAEYLYRTCPHLPEGEMTALRVALVREETLSAIAQHLELRAYLFVGRGEEASGGRQRPSILSSALEALIGAIFLDQGWERTRHWLLSLLEEELKRAIERGAPKDAKSRLQELTQAKLQLTPTYRTLATEGLPHDRMFTVEVGLGDKPLAQGQGKTKQEAEQAAATRALRDWA
ncbi:MAG: ribonuclease III [Chloroflexota bacterium]